MTAHLLTGPARTRRKDAPRRHTLPGSIDLADQLRVQEPCATADIGPIGMCSGSHSTCLGSVPAPRRGMMAGRQAVQSRHCIQAGCVQEAVSEVQSADHARATSAPSACSIRITPWRQQVPTSSEMYRAYVRGRETSKPSPGPATSDATNPCFGTAPDQALGTMGNAPRERRPARSADHVHADGLPLPRWRRSSTRARHAGRPRSRRAARRIHHRPARAARPR
jgi:hypothetical protein